MSNPWFRLYSRIMNDPVIEFLSFEDQRHYVWILCLKNEGILDEDYAQPWMLERVVARKLGLQGEAFENTKQRLLETELIDNKWQPRNWDSLQFKSDSSTERVRKYRKNKGAEDSKTNETLQKRYETVTVTPPDTDTDTDTEITPPISPPGDEGVSPPVAKKQKRSPIPKSGPWPSIQALVDKYNSETPDEFIAVSKITDAREKKIRDYLAQFRDEDWWTDVFAECHRSRFLRGYGFSDGRTKPFLAGLDWLLQKGKGDAVENCVKVYEGKYRDEVKNGTFSR